MSVVRATTPVSYIDDVSTIEFRRVVSPHPPRRPLINVNLTQAGNTALVLGVAGAAFLISAEAARHNAGVHLYPVWARAVLMLLIVLLIAARLTVAAVGAVREQTATLRRELAALQGELHRVSAHLGTTRQVPAGGMSAAPAAAFEDEDATARASRAWELGREWGRVEAVRDIRRGHLPG